jgi:hypothetical protein
MVSWWWWVDKPSGLCFEQGRGDGGWTSPSVVLKHETEVVWVDKPSSLHFRQGRGCSE